MTEPEWIEVKCGKCDHKWKYKGKLLRATCPSCGNKVMIKKEES